MKSKNTIKRELSIISKVFLSVKKEIIPKDASDKFIQFIPITKGVPKKVSPSVFPYVYSPKIIPVFTPTT